MICKIIRRVSAQIQGADEGGRSYTFRNRSRLRFTDKKYTVRLGKGAQRHAQQKGEELLGTLRPTYCFLVNLHLSTVTFVSLEAGCRFGSLLDERIHSCNSVIPELYVTCVLEFAGEY